MEKVRNFENVSRFCKENCIVLVQGKEGNLNPITIGWKTIGNLWGKDVITIAIHPSRFSYQLLNEGLQEFSVNFLPTDKRDIIKFCGNNSGRNTDKLISSKLKVFHVDGVKIPILQDANLAYTCKVIHTAESGDISRHRLFIGEIMGSFIKLD